MPEFRVISDLAYGDHPRARIDLIVPSGSTNAPLVFCVHGGGWSGGHRLQYALTGFELANRGFASALIGYPLMPDRLWPQMGYDIYAAAAWIKSNAGQYGIDTSRMVTWGSSAGAQLTLALHAFADDWKAAGAVRGDCPAIIGSVAHCVAFDLVTYDSDNRRRFMGSASPETVSPAHIEPSRFRSIFVAHSKPDRLFPSQDVLSWVERLKAAGVDADSYISDSGEHGYLYNIISDDARSAFEASVGYLKRIFKKE
ncbi:MAG: alpha/beta hydrolase [Planctomycetota bacterium]